MEADNLVIKDTIVQENVENTSEQVVEAEEIVCELSVTPPAINKSEEISVIKPNSSETNVLDQEKQETLAEEIVLDSLVEEKEVRIPVETVKKQHKRLVLADSDSEDEDTAVPVDKEAVENQQDIKDVSEDEETISKHPNRLDSDSENEAVDEGQSDELKGKRIKALVDSDSEDEKQGDNVDVAPMYVVNHKGELIPESAAENQLQKSRLAALCDSESDEENRNDSDEESAAPVNYKPTNKSKKRVDEPKKMTFKDAEQQKMEITADRQRSIREAQVSLPYHKPKMRTLKEFFASRPKPVTSLTLGTRPSVGIKIANEQIHEITRNLKTREKELKEFYKSESEAEDEEDKDDKDYVPSGAEIKEAELELDAKITEIPTEAEELIIGEGDKVVEEKKLEVRKALDFSFDEDSHEEVTLKNIEEELSTNLVVADEIAPIETEPEPVIPKTKFELLKEKLANKIVPRLSVNPSESINLETGRTQLNEVDQLVERFIKHTSKQKVQKHQVELSVVSVSGGQVHKDTVAMRVDDEEELKLIEEKPGARFHKLRDELQAQMAQKRSELWALKKQNHKDEEIDEQKDDYEDDVILDDEEEEEMSCSDEEEEEIYENEEDDEELMEEVESKSEFIADEAEEEDEEEEVEDKPEKKTLRRIVTQADSDSDDEICAAQPLRLDNGTPQRPLTLPNHIEFLTPVSYITGLQNLNSASKLPKESPILERPLAAEPSPLKEINWQPGLQKKLFSDIESEEPLDESVGEDEEPSTQELLGVCSGQFTGVTQIVEVQEEEVAKEDFDHDVIISQLLDEDEMESFKKKFQSPLLEGGAIESDDEDGDLVRTKKKQKKLVFSDDEDEEDEDVEERIDLHDEDLENIAYDSEENEVEVDANFVEEKKMKVKDFVENEAELSGSEWGSADEDEQDLDLVDFELGDNEKFDEDKLKRGLEKIHMRRILDDDTREVKLLQEMLLEDGELHGTGRERQFKWKNIDALSGDVEEEKKEGEEQYLDEEESEEQWRKQRHEREMFLKEQNNSKVDEDVVDAAKQLLDGSQLLIQRSQSLSLPSQKEVSTTLSQPLSLLSKRGSFLARGDEVLDRLAEFNKVTDVNLGAVKPSRNFLFSTVDATVDKKRKASDGTPTAIKKLRLSENFSPLVERKKNNRAKQLFSTGTW